MRNKGNVPWAGLAIAGAVLVGVAVRVWQIRYSFDDDEMFSVSLASDTFIHTITRSMADTPHPPLHNILLYGWLRLFGTSEVAARSLSVLFSCGFIALSFRTLRRYTNTWVSFGVALMAALSPLLVYYGQQARPYSLIALLSVANLYAFLKVLDSPGEKAPIRIWALTGVGLVYSQYMGVLFIGAQMFWAVVDRRENRWSILAYGSAAIASLGLWVAAAMGTTALHGANPVPQITWIARPYPRDFGWFYALTFGNRFPMRWLFALLAVLAIAYGRWVYQSKSFPKQHRLLLLMALGLPLFAYVVSVLGPKHIFVARQLVGSALAALMVVGLAANELPKWAGRLIICVFVVWAGASTRMALPDRATPDWRGTSAWIEQQYGRQMLVAEEPYCQEALTFYRKAGAVPLWNDLSAAAKSSRFLFACRPMQCEIVQALGTRATLVKTWHWNTQAGDKPYNQLKLYAVEAR